MSCSKPVFGFTCHHFWLIRNLNVLNVKTSAITFLVKSRSTCSTQIICQRFSGSTLNPNLLNDQPNMLKLSQVCSTLTNCSTLNQICSTLRQICSTLNQICSTLNQVCSTLTNFSTLNHVFNQFTLKKRFGSQDTQATQPNKSCSM